MIAAIEHHDLAAAAGEFPGALKSMECGFGARVCETYLGEIEAGAEKAGVLGFESSGGAEVEAPGR